MSLIPYYLQYLSEICDGSRLAPDGIVLTETDDLKKAIELQSEIGKIGIPAFVRACAKADGTEIPQEDYDSFDPKELNAAISALASSAEDTTAETKAPEGSAPTETRDIYEVFLDSVLLDDKLLRYLIDILRRKDKKEFETLSRAAARTVLDMDDFLAWLGNKELLGTEEEQVCVAIMDGCMERLKKEGQLQLIAALLSGDEKTFKVFRLDAPELQHLPAATYEWYCENYVDRYYPVRFMLRFNGVSFPQSKLFSQERRKTL